MALLCFGLSSCIYDDGTMADEPDIPDTSMMISFDITTQSVATRVPGSRGTWGGDENDREEGVGHDNKIDFSTICMGIYDPSVGNIKNGNNVGDLVAKVTDILKVGESDRKDESHTIQKRIYHCRGEITVLKGKKFPMPNKTYQIVVFVNTPNVLPSLENPSLNDKDFKTIEALDQVPFTPKWDETTGELKTDIPMFAFKQNNFSGLKPGKSYDIGDIYLLRAMAKVSVEMNSEDEESKKWKVKKIDVFNTNKKGFAAPKWDIWIKKPSTLDLGINDDVNGGQNGDSFNPDNNGEFNIPGKLWTDSLYLPEKCVNVGKEIKLKVTIAEIGNETNTKNGEILFRHYKEGKPLMDNKDRFDIIRNHFYQFTVQVDGKDNLRFHVTIADMENGGVFNYEYDLDE